MCEHDWVAIGTEKFCVKCGKIYGSADEKPAPKANAKPKKKPAENAKKQVSTAKAE